MKVAFIILLYLTLCFSTTLYGEIYNGETFDQSNSTALKFIGPTSTQGVFSGNYSIELPEGRYIIYAYGKYENQTIRATENITVAGQIMEFDFVLFSSDFDGEYGLNIEENTPTNPYQWNDLLNILLFIVIVITVGFCIWTYMKPRNKKVEELSNGSIDGDCSKVLRILKENEGRMIQKEIREILNFSESKMSLIITELEVGGLIKRIKKGRENIIKITNKGEL